MGTCEGRVGCCVRLALCTVMAAIELIYVADEQG